MYFDNFNNQKNGLTPKKQFESSMVLLTPEFCTVVLGRIFCVCLF